MVKGPASMEAPSPFVLHTDLARFKEQDSIRSIRSGRQELEGSGTGRGPGAAEAVSRMWGCGGRRGRKAKSPRARAAASASSRPGEGGRRAGAGGGGVPTLPMPNVRRCGDGRPTRAREAAFVHGQRDGDGDGAMGHRGLQRATGAHTHQPVAFRGCDGGTDVANPSAVGIVGSTG